MTRTSIGKLHHHLAAAAGAFVAQVRRVNEIAVIASLAAAAVAVPLATTARKVAAAAFLAGLRGKVLAKVEMAAVVRHVALCVFSTSLGGAVREMSAAIVIQTGMAAIKSWNACRERNAAMAWIVNEKNAFSSIPKDVAISRTDRNGRSLEQ